MLSEVVRKHLLKRDTEGPINDDDLEIAIHVGWTARNDEIEHLKAENARYREALEFYANQSNWSYTTIQDSKWYETLEDDATEINGNHYSGRRAREALKGE